MFPTKAIEMIAVYKMAKVSLILNGYENGGCVVEPEREWSAMVKAKIEEIGLQRVPTPKGDIDSDSMQ